MRTLLTSLLAFSVAACTTSGDKAPTTAPDIASATFASSLGVNLAASIKTPTGLYYRDIATGTGAAVATGKQVTVKYTGWLANGTQFDSGTIPFVYGVGQVIQGWDQGLGGMLVGGKRQLVIPPSLGYGASGSGPIPGNAILVFNVEIISVP